MLNLVDAVRSKVDPRGVYVSREHKPLSNVASVNLKRLKQPILMHSFNRKVTSWAAIKLETALQARVQT